MYVTPSLVLVAVDGSYNTPNEPLDQCHLHCIGDDEW
jgi:hypothetical protein